LARQPKSLLVALGQLHDLYQSDSTVLARFPELHPNCAPRCSRTPGLDATLQTRIGTQFPLTGRQSESRSNLNYWLRFSGEISYIPPFIGKGEFQYLGMRKLASS